MVINTERDAEIADLKAHIAGLEARLVKLEPQLTPAPSPARTERGVTISHPPAMPSAGLLPDQQQMDELLNIVWRARPDLKPPAVDERNFADGVRTCIAWLMRQRRQETLNTKYHFLFWLDGVRLWCRSAQRSASGVDGRSLAVAILAVGDCLYRADFQELGLVYGFEAPPNDAGWRKILSDGKPLDPVPLNPTVIGRQMVRAGK